MAESISKTHKVEPEKEKVSVIVFSKNRAWQLSEYLRTLYKYLEETVDLKIYVIYKADSIFRPSYSALRSTYINVIFIEETDFKSDLLFVINNIKTEFCLFGVDDVLFYRKFNLIDACDLLQMDYNIVSYSLRLNPNITYCQPANTYFTPPTLYTSDKQYMEWRWLTAAGDWNYPWEVSASLYRLCNIKDLVKYLVKNCPEKLQHPNTFEAMGAIIAPLLFCQQASSCCQNKAVCSTITINRVQDLYPNTIYEEKSIEYLDTLFWERKEYNEEYYRNKVFNSIHIGDFVLKD